MVASLVGMAQQPGISSAVGEPVEPTNKLWEKKMYPEAKKVSIFSKNPLTHRILPVQSFTEHRTQNTEHRTQNTEHRTQNTEHRTRHTKYGVQHNSIYSVNFLSHTTEAAGGIFVCGLAAFKSFFPSHHPGSLSGWK